MVAALASKSPEITTVNHRDTGEELYSLVGRYPKYFHNLLFETEEIAEEAKEEAEWVLENEERPDDSKFCDAYLKTSDMSDRVIVRE